MEGRASSQLVQQDREDKWKGALTAKQLSRIEKIMEGRASSQAVQQDSEDKWKGALPAKQFSRIVRINGRAHFQPSSSAG